MSEIDLRPVLQLYEEYKLVEDRLKDLPSSVGENALRGAFEPIYQSIESIEGAYDHLEAILQNHLETVDLLLSTKKNLELLGVSSAEVDEKYAAELESRRMDSTLGLAIAVVQSGETVVALTTDVEPAPEPTEKQSHDTPKTTQPTQPAPSETGEDNRPTFSVTFGVNDKGRPAIFMNGSRKKEFDLMGFKHTKADQDFGRPDVKLAIVKVLSDASVDGVMAVDFKQLVEDELGYEITGSKDGRNALNTARSSVFEKMKWGGQKIFKSSGNGASAKYYVNQKITVRPDFQITSEDIATVQHMMKERAEKLAMQFDGNDTSTIDESDTTINSESELALLHEKLPELPTVREIVSLLVSIDYKSVKLDELLELADIPGDTTSDFFSKYTEWYENLDKLIKSNEMNLTDPRQLEESRLQTLDSLLDLIGDKQKLEHVIDTLNTFETDSDNAVVETLFDIIDTLVCMPDEDVEVLRAILIFQTGLAVRQFGGSFTAGQSIYKVQRVFEVNGRRFKLVNDEWKVVGEKTDSSLSSEEEEILEVSDAVDLQATDDGIEEAVEIIEEADIETEPEFIIDIREAINSLSLSHIFGANGLVKSIDETISVRELNRLTSSRKIGTRESLLRAKSAGILKGRIPTNSSEFQKIQLKATQVVAIYLLNNHPDTVGNTGSRRKQRDSLAKIQKELEKFFETVK